jgi:hypothetical protein
MTHTTFALRTIHHPTADLRRRARFPYGTWVVSLALIALGAVSVWFAFSSAIAGTIGFALCVLLLLGVLRVAIQNTVYRSVARNALALRAALARIGAMHGPIKPADMRAYLAADPSPEVYGWRDQIAVLVEERALTESQGMLDAPQNAA